MLFKHCNSIVSFKTGYNVHFMAQPVCVTTLQEVYSSWASKRYGLTEDGLTNTGTCRM
jgi:hypothetical protein